MIIKSVYNKNIKKENILAIAGIALLIHVFILNYELLQQASGLMIIVSAGFLAKLKFRMIGGVSLLLAGLALLVYPFLYLPVYMLIPGTSFSAFAGLFVLINWWYNNQDVNQS